MTIDDSCHGRLPGGGGCGLVFEGSKNEITIATIKLSHTDILL